MSLPVPMEITPAAYRAIGPDGAALPLTKEIFEALQDISRRKGTGSVIIDFKSGGIAGVEMTVRKVYK